MKGTSNEKEHETQADCTFCYVSWEAAGRPFASEAKRIRLIRGLCMAAMYEGCSINAFIVLDDSIHLLLHAENKRALQSGYLPARLKNASAGCWPEEAEQQKLRESCSGWSIRAGQEAARFCCDIHMLALRRHYVEDLNDYWFSSWQTYRGWYIWFGLNMDPVLDGISADREEALAVFGRHQRKGCFTQISKAF